MFNQKRNKNFLSKLSRHSYVKKTFIDCTNSTKIQLQMTKIEQYKLSKSLTLLNKLVRWEVANPHKENSAKTKNELHIKKTNKTA